MDEVGQPRGEGHPAAKSSGAKLWKQKLHETHREDISVHVPV